jgi:hypothetical protein
LIPKPAGSAFGAGSVLLLGVLLVSLGVASGSALGVPLRVSVAEVPPGECGLRIVPIMAEGLVGGAFLGALAGVVATVLIALRRR